MSEWRQTTLGEILGPKGYIRGPFGSALKRGELLSEGIPVYEQQHAIYGTRRFRFFIGDEKHRELSRFTVQPNDIIISCSGTLGRASVIRDGDPIGIISQALLILRPDTMRIDPFFLFYILSSPVGFHSMVSVSTGSVQVNIAKRSIIEGIRIALPPTVTGGQPIYGGSHNQGLIVKMFREGDPVGANALSARETLGPEWQDAVSKNKWTCFG